MTNQMSTNRRCSVISLPFKDISELYLENPGKFKENFNKAISQSVSFTKYEQEKLRKQETEAWIECKGLAQSKNILDEVYGEVCQMGVTGEQKLVGLLYLAMSSRFLDRPVSVAIKGPSSAGKSFVLETVIKLFPKEAYYMFTSMSDKVLAYSEADFKHRMILLAEASGLTSDFQSYLIRTLLSENRIIYEVVEKTRNGLKPRRMEKEGPTGFICTTTAVKLHEENETRLLSLTANDTQEQTKAILFTLAGKQNNVCNSVARRHAFQAWLETQTKEVEIPYAMELADRIPPQAVRLRRDFTTLLSLIRTNTILRQASRHRDTENKIVAGLEDYKTVYDLVNDLVSEGVEATVPKSVREAVKAVTYILSGKKKDEHYVVIREIAVYLDIDRRVASRRLRRGVDLGYLKNENPGKGKTAQYILGSSMPEDIQILPETLTWTPAQTGTLPDVQVEKTQGVDNTMTFSEKTQPGHLDSLDRGVNTTNKKNKAEKTRADGGAPGWFNNPDLLDDKKREVPEYVSL